MIRVRRALLAALPLALFAFVPAARHSAAAATAQRVGPKAYYLALGDSAAFGFQPNLQFWHGYADDFNANLKAAGVKHYINMGCDAETTTSFIHGDSGNHGNCTGWPLLKYLYSGPQLTAAVNFIAKHPGQVSPVTLDIGANDADSIVNSSACTLTASFTQTLATIDANVTTILSQLRAALHGMGDLFMMNYWFPQQNICPNLVPLAVIFNRHLAADAHRQDVPIADVFTAFGGPATPNPNICTYTWMCSRFTDIHATNRGYAVVAKTFEALAGY